MSGGDPERIQPAKDEGGQGLAQVEVEEATKGLPELLALNPVIQTTLVGVIEIDDPDQEVQADLDALLDDSSEDDILDGELILEDDEPAFREVLVGSISDLAAAEDGEGIVDAFIVEPEGDEALDEFDEEPFEISDDEDDVYEDTEDQVEVEYEETISTRRRQGRINGSLRPEPEERQSSELKNRRKKQTPLFGFLDPEPPAPADPTRHIDLWGPEGILRPLQSEVSVTVSPQKKAALDIHRFLRGRDGSDTKAHLNRLPDPSYDDILESENALEEDDKKEWLRFSNCLGVDPDLFFPERGASTKEAKQVCQGCVVREKCLEFALNNGEKFGIWGGLSERERRRIRRQRSLARAEQQSRQASALANPIQLEA